MENASRGKQNSPRDLADHLSHEQIHRTYPSTQVFKIDLATFTSDRMPLRLHVIVRCLIPRIMGAPVSFIRPKALLLVSAYQVAWASSGKRVCAVFRSSMLPPTMITAC